MDQSNTENKSFATLGRFMSIANSIELALNSMIEIIVLKYHSNFSSLHDIQALIDNLQRQSIKQRFLTVILFIKMTSIEDQNMKICDELIDLQKKYNSNIRDIRDFVAHNPLIQDKRTGKSLIIKSRSDRTRIDSLTIEEVGQAQKTAGEIAQKLLNITGGLQLFYKTDPSPRTIS